MDVGSSDLPANGVTQVQIIGDLAGPASARCAGLSDLAPAAIASAGWQRWRALWSNAQTRRHPGPGVDPRPTHYQAPPAMGQQCTKQNPDATASKAHRPSTARGPGEAGHQYLTATQPCGWHR